MFEILQIEKKERKEKCTMKMVWVRISYTSHHVNAICHCFMRLVRIIVWTPSVFFLRKTHINWKTAFSSFSILLHFSDKNAMFVQNEFRSLGRRVPVEIWGLRVFAVNEKFFSKDSYVARMTHLHISTSQLYLFFLHIWIRLVLTFKRKVSVFLCATINIAHFTLYVSIFPPASTKH